MATIIPAKPIMEPIERSNSPAIISRQAPTARMPRYADTCDQFMMPSRLNMPEPPAVIPNTTKTSTAPEIAANYGRFRMCPNRDSRRIRSSEEAAAVTVDELEVATSSDALRCPERIGFPATPMMFPSSFIRDAALVHGANVLMRERYGSIVRMT